VASEFLFEKPPFLKGFHKGFGKRRRISEVKVRCVRKIERGQTWEILKMECVTADLFRHPIPKSSTGEEFILHRPNLIARGEPNQRDPPATILKLGNQVIQIQQTAGKYFVRRRVFPPR